MALNFAHGSVQWLAANAIGTIYTVSGLPFEPKALRFYWVGIQSNSPTNAVSAALNENRGVGFAVSTASRRAIGSFNQNASAAANCGVIATNIAIAVTVDGNGAITGSLDLNTITTTGFTLIVDDTAPVNITVFYEAWGGDDITDASIGDIAEPAAIGTQNYTANGFTSDGSNQVVMFAGCQSTAALGTGQANDSGICVGFATHNDTTQNVTVCGNSDDGSATMDTDGYCIQGECLSMITVAGGNPSARATLNGYADNQFSLNWITRATTNRRYIYLAIKGGSWRSSSLTINANTLNATSTVSILPFNVRGFSLVGRGSVTQTAGVSVVNDEFSFGSASSITSRNSVGILDENATANVEIDTIIRYDSVLSYPTNAGAVSELLDVNSINVNTFSLRVDVAGGVANEWVGYLTFGDQRKPRTISVGHPTII